jgi:hypothetical protein
VHAYEMRHAQIVRHGAPTQQRKAWSAVGKANRMCPCDAP